MASIHDSPHPVPAPPSHPVTSTAAIKLLAAANQTLTSKTNPQGLPYTQTTKHWIPVPMRSLCFWKSSRNIYSPQQPQPHRENSPTSALWARTSTKSGCASETATLDRFPRDFFPPSKSAWTTGGCGSRNASRRAPMRPRCEGGSSSRAHYSQGRKPEEEAKLFDERERERLGATKKGLPGPKTPSLPCYGFQDTPGLGGQDSTRSCEDSRPQGLAH